MTTIPVAGAGHARARGASAAIALLLLVVGIPAALGALAPLELPSSPSWDDLLRVLAGPDDGTLLRQVLGLAAWVAWAGVAFSIVTEVLAVVRRRPTPRIPMLGVPQRAAAVLVATVVVGLVPGRPDDAHAVVPELPQRPALSEVSAPTLPTAHTRGAVARRSHTERREAGSDPSNDRHRSSAPTVVVQPHDTLWALAERHLGSGLRYREIVSLNKGRVQPDGRRLTDPHWIYPGWVLRLPSDATGDVVRRHTATREPAQQEAPVVAPDRASPRPLDRPVPAAALDVDRAPRAAALTPTPRDRTVVRPVVTSAAGLSGDLEDDPSRAPLVALGLGALTIAGVLAEVSRQRRAQQRSRRAGARIALSERAAGTERRLRSVGASPPARRVQDGLALLVDGCRQRGKELPRVALVRASAARLELELHAEAGAPPDPFVAVGPRTWVWSGNESPPADPDRIALCPALISVGTAGEDLVLVNLEAAGSLRVQAETARAAPVLAAMTADLVSRSRAGTVTLAVVDGIPGAAALAESVGVETIPAGTVGDRVRGHATDVAEVLRHDDAGDVAAARGHEVSDEVWTPQVVVSEATDAQAAPWSGSHVLAVGEGAGWALVPEHGDSWRLDPFALRLRPAALHEPERSDIADLLRPAPHANPTESPELATLISHLVLLLQQVSVPPATAPASAGPVPGVPYVTVLGPVEVLGAEDALIAGRLRRATELAAYLALHPGASRYELDEVMWPGQRVARTTRNPFVSRARQWLGRTSDGRAYLPLVTDDGRYRLLPEVGCDWYDFVRAATAALTTHPTDVDALVSALALVRGRPFQGVDPTGYSWADADVQEIVSAVVDVAHVTAEILLANGDAVGAARATADGLRVEPCSELLHCDAIRAAAARGDRAGVARAVARMKSSLEALGLEEDLLPETVELLDRIGAR